MTLFLCLRSSILSIAGVKCRLVLLCTSPNFHSLYHSSTWPTCSWRGYLLLLTHLPVLVVELYGVVGNGDVNPCIKLLYMNLDGSIDPLSITANISSSLTAIFIFTYTYMHMHMHNIMLPNVAALLEVLWTTFSLVIFSFNQWYNSLV